MRVSSTQVFTQDFNFTQDFDELWPEVTLKFEKFPKMSHQYNPSLHDRYGRYHQGTSPLSSVPSFQNDWRAQQSLFMGSNTPYHQRQVSLSPQNNNLILPMGPSVPPFPVQQPDTFSSSSGRIMYPSPVYQYGNPGFYYDPLQFPASVESQTPARFFPHPTGPASGPCTLPYNNNNNGPHTVQQPVPTQPSSVASPVLYSDTSNHSLPSPDDESMYNSITPHVDPSRDDDGNLHFHPHIHDVGCQVSQTIPPPVTVIKEARKLSLPHYDPSKMTWTSFAMKLHASLIECDLAYLLREESTTSLNSAHSKELMLELFKKLQGSALSLFTGMTAQRYYLEGGHGIEMIKALVNKFHPLDNREIQNIISSMQTLVLLDSEDLSIYRDKLENYNLQLSWVGQEMSDSFLVFLAQSQLSKSRYKDDIAALQMSHTASGTSFTSLDDLCQGLERLDKMRGLPYGGAAITPKIPIVKTPLPKRSTTAGFVAAVQTSMESDSSLFEMHKEAWIGAVNLSEDHVKQLRQMFKCAQCRSNEHTFPSCPLMKNWIIRKKPRNDTSSESDSVSRSIGGVNSVLASSIPSSSLISDTVTTSAPSSSLEPILEDSNEVPEDHYGGVEFDLLEDSNSLNVMTISGTVTPYFEFIVPMGSVRSVASSQVTLDHAITCPRTFDLIVDSGCTRHMFPFKEAFISYKPTPHSYVILADKSKVACLGFGTASFMLQNKHIILHDVLHVPKLRSPLLSVRCFRRLNGCSFLADNSGSFLTFPKFILSVDDSSDCTILGSLATQTIDIHFDSRIVGSISAVSDNTRHRKQRRPVYTKSRETSSTSAHSMPINETHPNFIPSPSLSHNFIQESSDLPVINETYEDNTPTVTGVITDPITSTLKDLNIDPSSLSSPHLSQTQIQEITTAIIRHLTKHGKITLELINFIKDGYSSSKNTTSTTPVGRPTLMSSDKMSNTAPLQSRFTIQQLSRYFGFRSFKNWDTLHDVCQPNFSFINPSENPLELGHVANIKKARSNKTPIDRPSDYLEVVHCDIGYGDSKSIGNGASHCILFVDRATRYTWIYPLKSLHHTSIKEVLSQWTLDAGSFPKRLYTDFDHKILDGPTSLFLRENKVLLRGAPNGRQNQNGLVERAWQTITNMGRAFITDMQMPRNFWYWALRQSVQVLNYIPCTVEGLSTTPHELVYGVKPDLRVLFRMFSTGFFRHLRDGSQHRSGITDSKSMQGIALGRCRKSDGMIFYCPHNKQIYTSSDYKLDEGRHTPNTFNLKYDGGIFVGLYNHSSPNNSIEPFPEGTSVSFPVKSPHDNTSTIRMRGTVISVPISSSNAQLPLTDDDAPPYVIRLVDGSVHKVSPEFLMSIVTDHISESPKICFPSWLGNSQKVMFLHDGIYKKGFMEWDLDNSTWRFSQRRRNGTEIFGTTLSNFCQTFQQYIDDGSLIPGWHGGQNFHLAGVSRHISASTLHSLIPPGSVTKALYPRNPDKDIWLSSYKEEYDGLSNNDTFDIISEEEYIRLCKVHGIKAMPSMCTFTIKRTNGVPTRAKSRIVVLGNFDPRPWTKADCFSPVVSIPMVRLLTALAVHNKRTIKQGDCKFAFIQASLPEDELTIVKPPVGCPFSGKRTYWRLKKSLYGLRRAPRHWYKLLSTILQSPEIGLTPTKHDPCIFHGTIIPGKPPLYLAIYVDDFLYFSLDDEVEQYFETALSQKLKVDFLGDAEWYLGMKFDWNHHSDGSVGCRISQEGYAATIVEEMGLTHANKSPLMTPFRSGFPIDVIPLVDMSPEDRAPLIAKMQSWLGMINWLQMCTRPDLATIFSLLSSYMHCPSPGHLEAVKHVGKYILSTMDLGLQFTSKPNSSLESFIHFPLSDGDPLDPSTTPSFNSFCDANWGPQDASKPSATNLREVSILESRSICGHIFFMGGCPILWKTHKEARISRSSCEAEVKATDECVKNVQMFRHVLTDLHLIDTTVPTNVYNDNRGSVDWSNSFSTKGMRHVNIRENAVREARMMNEVSIHHIPGAANPADLFTKEFKSDATFRALRNLTLFYPSSFKND